MARPGRRNENPDHRSESKVGLSAGRECAYVCLCLVKRFGQVGNLKRVHIKNPQGLTARVAMNVGMYFERGSSSSSPKASSKNPASWNPASICPPI